MKDSHPSIDFGRDLAVSISKVWLATNGAIASKLANSLHGFFSVGRFPDDEIGVKG